jgi:glucose-6-phosphate 1-dehydrogenase
MVIYGATGDLMGRKIVPALFDLFVDKKLPALFNIVGVSRRDWKQQDFQDFIKQILLKYKNNQPNAEIDNFVKLFHFVPGDVEKKMDYESLGKYLGQIDGKWNVCANKLFYLAVSPEFFKTIFKNLHESHLTDPCSPEQGWTRIIVEKPFGTDLKTAEELDSLLGSIFKEVQIYRIDHYLAKEMIQNILTFRFSNNLFEQNWTNETIDSIDVKLWEDLGVEERGSFYDKVGALRDVGQNHLLQMLAFITMDEPAHLNADDIRAKRAESLAFLPYLDLSQIKKQTFRAQYDGYKTIKNVAENSSIETYFKIQMKLSSPKWQGVNVVLESGKRMGEKRKEIIVTFKHPTPCFCPEPNREHYKNRVIFSMEPTEGIKIEFWSKKPGLDAGIEKRSFDFLLQDGAHKKQYVEEYKKLMLDCINGDQTLFISTDEMKAMWKFVDPIIKTWQKNSLPLHTYTPNSAVISAQATETIESFTEKNYIARELVVVGLGKMGANMVRRLLEKDWKIFGFNRSQDVVARLEEKGMVNLVNLSDIKNCFSSKPRVVWLMLPAGDVIDGILFDKKMGIVNYLNKGDIVIDGGNSFYKDALRRSKKLKTLGIDFIDVGTSGGPGGARNGACLMIGGEEKVFKKLEPLFKDFAADSSYQFFPGVGAGHFVKMVHNGIEYGMMQAIAEGYAILKKVKYRLNLKDVNYIYSKGSVIESRLITWLGKALELHGEDLKKVPGKVGYTGEGEWTVKTAKELKLKAKIIEESFKFRVKSQKEPDYTGKILMALREQFGGHKK